MEFLKSIKKLFLSAYSRLKENVIGAYRFVSGRYKIIDSDYLVDTHTGELIRKFNFGRIGDAIGNSVTNILLGRMYFTEKPESLKGQIVRAVSVLGINTLLAAGIIFIEGTKFSYLLLLKIVFLLYIIDLILEITEYSYSFLYRDKYSNSVEPLEGQVASTSDNVVSDDVITSEGTLAPEEETSAPDELVNEQVVKDCEALASGLAIHDEDVLAPQEKLETSMLALAIFVAKYSSKGSIVTSEIMYCAFVCDFNTLPQGYKVKLKDFYLKHQEELAAISLSIEGEQLIPIKQYRAFCKERMFTKDSSYSKAKYSNEFYSLVKSRKS